MQFFSPLQLGSQAHLHRRNQHPGVFQLATLAVI
jgi:hypothetical protein